MASIYMASIYDLEHALNNVNAALDKKHIFSINMEYGLGLSTDTIAFWRIHLLHISNVDYIFNT